MAGTETKRIIELTEASTVQSGDFIAVDSNARGTKKVSTDTLATSAALTAETNARTGADEQMSERMDGIEEQTALIQNPTKTLSGALCSFTDGADMPMVACTASITPKQSGSGTPSPSNVRTISGWESVSVTDAGKNLCNPQTDTGSDKTYRGVTLSTNDDVISLSGTATANGGRTELILKTVHLKAGNYYISVSDTTGVQPQVLVQSISGSTYTVVADRANIRLTLSQDADIGVGFGVTSGTAYSSTLKLQIELGSTATTYEPCTGTTHTTDLGRTVYGGTLDVVSGVLTVDMAMVDLGTLNWTYVAQDTTIKGFYAFLPQLKTGYAATDKVPFICSKYETGGIQWARISDGQIGTNESNTGSTTQVIIKDSSYTDALEFKSSLNGTQLVYPLAEPQTYQLTPQEVKTLLGDNNVWTDSGDVEITYRRDISIVINNLESALNG